MRSRDGDSGPRARRQLVEERAVIRQAANGVKRLSGGTPRGRFGQEDGKALADSVAKRFRGGLPQF